MPMAIFLHEPRYRFGCLGFYTEPSWGRRILQAGAVITCVGMLTAVAGSVFLERGNAEESIFLIVAAWILIFVLMRLFWTGTMWVFSLVFEWKSDGVPGLSGAMYFLKRAYWVLGEVFLSVAFLATLVAAVFVAIGALSMG